MRFMAHVFAVVVLGYQQFPNFGASGVQDCRTTLDMVIIVDSSLSVGLRNFKNVTAFVQNLVRYLPVQEDGVRVGVVRYATDATVVSYLNQDTSKDEKLMAIKNMRYKIGSTYTHVALQLTRKSVLVPERGDRPDVPNLIILMTDGASNKQELTLLEAETLKENDNNKIFVIGIGKDVADNELVGVASRPEMVYKLTNFSQLADIVGRLARFSCSDMDEDSISHLGTWSEADSSLTHSVRTNSPVSAPTSSRQPLTASSSRQPLTAASSRQPLTAASSRQPLTAASSRQPLAAASSRQPLTAASSRQLLAATPSLPQTTSPTITLSQPVPRSSVHPPNSQTNQSISGQRSLNATVSSKSELINPESTFSSSPITIDTGNMASSSSLFNTTDQHTFNKTRHISNSGVTIATQTNTDTEVVQDKSETASTKENIVTAQQYAITASNHLLNSNLTTPSPDFKLSTKILTLSHSSTTESSSLHQYSNQNYSQSKSTISLTRTTAAVNKTTIESTKVLNTNTAKPYLANTSITLDTIYNMNTTLNTISNMNTTLDTISNMNTTLNITPIKVNATPQTVTRSSTGGDVPSSPVANTPITTYTSTTSNATVFKIQTTTDNTTTSPHFHFYPTLVTNNSITRSDDKVDHHTTNMIDETDDQLTTTLSSETVDQHTTSVSDRTISYPTQSGISETEYLHHQSTTVTVPTSRASAGQSFALFAPTSHSTGDQSNTLAASTSRAPADQSTIFVAFTSRAPADQSTTLTAFTSRTPDNSSSTLAATISRASTDQSFIVLPRTLQLENQTSAVLPLITQGLLNQTSPWTSTSNKRHQTKHTQSIKRHSTKRTHRTSTVSRSAPTYTDPTRLHSSGKTRLSSTTVVIEYKTLTRNSEIDIEIIETNDINPGQTGGDISSRDLYIFVAGGSAAAIILLAVGTFLAVLFRRRNVSSVEDVDV